MNQNNLQPSTSDNTQDENNSKPIENTFPHSNTNNDFPGYDIGCCAILIILFSGMIGACWWLATTILNEMQDGNLVIWLLTPSVAAIMVVIIATTLFLIVIFLIIRFFARMGKAIIMWFIGANEVISAVNKMNNQMLFELRQSNQEIVSQLQTLNQDSQTLIELIQAQNSNCI